MLKIVDGIYECDNTKQKLFTEIKSPSKQVWDSLSVQNFQGKLV